MRIHRLAASRSRLTVVPSLLVSTWLLCGSMADAATTDVIKTGLVAERIEATLLAYASGAADETAELSSRTEPRIEASVKNPREWLIRQPNRSSAWLLADLATGRFEHRTWGHKARKRHAYGWARTVAREALTFEIPGGRYPEGLEAVLSGCYGHDASAPDVNRLTFDLAVNDDHEQPTLSIGSSETQYLRRIVLLEPGDAESDLKVTVDFVLYYVSQAFTTNDASVVAEESSLYTYFHLLSLAVPKGVRCPDAPVGTAWRPDCGSDSGVFLSRVPSSSRPGPSRRAQRSPTREVPREVPTREVPAE